MNDYRRKTPDGQIGLLETPSGYCVTTWTASGRIEGTMSLTKADAKALLELFAEAAEPSSTDPVKP